MKNDFFISALSFLRLGIERFVQGWDKFFFARASYRSIGIFRMFLSLNLFLMYAIRQVHWRFYFTSEGILSNAQAHELLSEGFRPLIYWFPEDPINVLLLHSGYLVVLMLLFVGVGSRLWSWVAVFLHLVFLNRNYTIAYGADIISCFLLFGLALMDSDRELSLMSWRRSRRILKSTSNSNSGGDAKAVEKSGSKLPPNLQRFGKFKETLTSLNHLLSSLGVRLMQIQLCVIYGYTGLEKIKGQVWWEGSAVWEAFGNQQMNMLDLHWLARFPVMIGIMTLSSMLFEVYFPVLIWGRRSRYVMLAFGVMLHVMIGITMGLVFFSGAILSGYVLFIGHRDWMWLKRQFNQFNGQFDGQFNGPFDEPVQLSHE